VGSCQRRRERAAQECPVDEVVGVVPPVDGVVEIERVADRVDEKRQDEEDVAGVGIRGAPTTSSPDRRNDERRDRVANEPPAKGLAGKPFKTRKSPEGQEQNERDLDSDVEPEGRSHKKGKVSQPRSTCASAAQDEPRVGRRKKSSWPRSGRTFCGYGRSWIRTTDLRLIRAAL
jgi:hypothetical protein